eukprot:TRINITY_DN3746_c0_g1_i1.p1 TRINITY_DN3746_c0_g1~~TRINITY_DN3746_c0_g1_i1.p1  ORF type:complete len:164 (-),score=51.80 TRINITY_DN3746_c0_g1_i1:38-529(-)
MSLFRYAVRRTGVLAMNRAVGARMMRAGPEMKIDMPADGKYDNTIPENADLDPEWSMMENDPFLENGPMTPGQVLRHLVIIGIGFGVVLKGIALFAPENPAAPKEFPYAYEDVGGNPDRKPKTTEEIRAWRQNMLGANWKGIEDIWEDENGIHWTDKNKQKSL